MCNLWLSCYSLSTPTRATCVDKGHDSGEQFDTLPKADRKGEHEKIIEKKKSRLDTGRTGNICKSVTAIAMEHDAAGSQTAT